MARNSELESLVQNFVNQLDAIVTRRANEAFASKFDTVKSQILGSVAAPARGRVGRPPGSRASYSAELKPCPVCGKQNKARRFSYLCEDHRSAENLSKFKGAAKAAPVVKRGPGRPPKSAAAPAPVKRGPGRPPKNAAKTA